MEVVVGAGVQVQLLQNLLLLISLLDQKLTIHCHNLLKAANHVNAIRSHLKSLSLSWTQLDWDLIYTKMDKH